MPTMYGLGPNGERRCLESEVLELYEKHNYSKGVVSMNDGTRLASSSFHAERVGWTDIAKAMKAKGL